MRKLYASTFISLDGGHAGTRRPRGGSHRPLRPRRLDVPYFDEAVEEWMGRTSSEPFDLLLGRKTYDMFAAYWPSDTESPAGTALNPAHKYVASHKLTYPTWADTTILSGDVISQVAELKRQDGPALNVQGSGNLIQVAARRRPDRRVPGPRLPPHPRDGEAALQRRDDVRDRAAEPSEAELERRRTLVD